MFAIVEIGGKQYKVHEGMILDVEKVEASDDTVTLDKVLLLSQNGAVQIGTPYLEGVTIGATVLNHFKAPKVIVFKFKNKTGYKKKQGHRQNLTTLRFTRIGEGSGEAVPAKPKAKVAGTVKKASKPVAKAAKVKKEA